jgi:hypothetical protein
MWRRVDVCTMTVRCSETYLIGVISYAAECELLAAPVFPVHKVVYVTMGRLCVWQSPTIEAVPITLKWMTKFWCGFPQRMSHPLTTMGIWCVHHV